MLTEHLTHVTQAIRWLFVLACLLTHLFHGHHGREQPKEQSPRP
ncbi:DUF2933 domain-containing protein [uncultured Piscinibacter sp.]|nr:DUF2933 domain-containing protein [uncultured Piscinibacter sp.]